ncbi:MAG TPA: alpha/beta fold hydrolase [Candidatus Eisenbacteria bacterium]|nr:alpha/beta fold hydrolase [Candidatus Eisenbacteria bacterium]
MHRLRASIVFLLLLLPAAPAFPAPGVQLRPYTYVSSKKDTVAAEWGTLRVPENRSKPGSRTIELAFVRFRSTSDHPGPPIVYLAGGPGNSGIDAARGRRFAMFMALRSVADVIAFDQRGIGHSTPAIDCSERSDYPMDRPGDRAAWLKDLGEKCRQCRDSVLARGADLDAYTVSESADDLDALREALGAESITPWAISYGVTLALDFMRRHPTRAHRAILAGVEGLDDMLKPPGQVDSMLRVVAALASHDSAVGKDMPDLIGLMRKQIQTLERRPISVRIANEATRDTTDSLTVVLGPYDYRWAAYQLLGTADYEWLPGFAWTLERGDIRTQRWWAGIVARERRSGIGQAVTYCTDCASGASPWRRARVKAKAPSAVLQDVANILYPDVCDAWKVKDLGEGFRRNVADCRVPTLFISGTLDVRTPPVQAEAARAGFRTSTHLQIVGATHSDPLFLSSPRILEAMLEFLKTGTTSTARLEIPIRFQPVRAFND